MHLSYFIFLCVASLCFFESKELTFYRGYQVVFLIDMISVHHHIIYVFLHVSGILHALISLQAYLYFLNCAHE